MKFLYTGLIICLFQCQCNPHRQIRIIDSHGLYEEYLNLKTMIFSDFDNGFVSGSIDSVFSTNKTDTFAILKREAVIFKTTNGGLKWEKKVVGEGFIREMFISDNKIFAVKDEGDGHISILYTEDRGDEWKSLNSVPANTYFLFVLNNTFYAMSLTEDSEKSTLNISYDKGLSWKSSTHFDHVVYNCIVKDSYLVFVASDPNDSISKKLLISYNLSNSNSKAIELPKNFTPDFLTKYDNELNLSGKQSDSIVVYKIENDNLKLRNVYYDGNGGSFLQGYYNWKADTWIILGIRTGSGVKNTILKASDGDQEWQNISFNIDNYIKPFYFISQREKTKGLFYSGLEKFQILNQ